MSSPDEPSTDGIDHRERRWAQAGFDDLAWEKNEEDLAESKRWIFAIPTQRGVEAVATDRLKERARPTPPVNHGSYNVIYPVRHRHTTADKVVRVPLPKCTLFPDEKTLAEVATARFIEGHTSIPVPKLLHYGLTAECPDLGPFIMMEKKENFKSMTGTTCIQSEEDIPLILDPYFPRERLRKLDLQVASYILQLMQHRFPRIGSLSLTGDDDDDDDDDPSYRVVGRPLTDNMHNMVFLANVPTAVLPPKDKTYDTADDWYLELAKMHMAQLIFQHNDLVSSADGCRTRYVARRLFLRLAKEGKLTTYGFAEDDWSAAGAARARTKATTTTTKLGRAPNDDDVKDSFPLWCDDFRPGNILLNSSDEVIAVIDWEFAYAAPTQFWLDPPWWLLLRHPETWEDGIEDWRRTYPTRLESWLEAVEEAEKNLIGVAQNKEEQLAPGGGGLDLPLSAYMRQSWETGRFWLNYATRNSWAFDSIYWRYLDEKFFGKREKKVRKDELWKTRIDLLTSTEREAMEAFVERKMEESKERKLVDWDADEARKRLAGVCNFWRG